MVVDQSAQALLANLTKRWGKPPRLGCSTVAHRELGFCAGCFDRNVNDPRLGTAHELSGWRLLAMAERGLP